MTEKLKTALHEVFSKRNADEIFAYCLDILNDKLPMPSQLQAECKRYKEALAEIISTDYKNYDNANAKLRSIAHQALTEKV